MPSFLGNAGGRSAGHRVCVRERVGHESGDGGQAPGQRLEDSQGLSRHPSVSHHWASGRGQPQETGQEAAPCEPGRVAAGTVRYPAGRQGELILAGDPESSAAGVGVLEPPGRRWPLGSSPGDRSWLKDTDPSHTRRTVTTNISPGDPPGGGEMPKAPFVLKH